MLRRQIERFGVRHVAIADPDRAGELGDVEHLHGGPEAAEQLVRAVAGPGDLVVGAPGFLDRVRSLGDRFEAGLRGLPFELRRRGLFGGIKLPNEGDGMLAAAKLFEAGIFAVFAANDTSVVQFLPPLVLTDAEADDIIGRIRSALA